MISDSSAWQNLLHEIWEMKEFLKAEEILQKRNWVLGIW